MTSSGIQRSRWSHVIATVLLLVLHFYVRPLVWDSRAAPDFLLLALILFAMQSGPGAGAVAGFIVGLVSDALTPAHFGAAMLGHTVVGALTAWGRAVFFADNSLVTAGFVAVGVWLRNVLVLLASGTTRGEVLDTLVGTGLLQALTTAIAALLLLGFFRRFFSVRLDL